MLGGVSATGYRPDYQPVRANRREQAAGGDEGFKESVKGTPSGGFTLHCFDSEEGDTAIGAWGQADGTSVTVYKTADFDPNHPVYKVKTWDAQGNVSEQMIDIQELDLTGCNSIEMWTYASHLSESGQYPQAQQRFMMGNALMRDTDSLYEKVNWVALMKDAMQMQYDLGNLQGYMDYKKFYDFLREQEEAGGPG